MDVVGGFFARKGYACVVQDVRGKFSSGGAFDPGVARGRGRLRHGRVGRRAGVVRRPRRAVGRVVLRHHVLAAAMSGHPAIACIAPGDIGVDRRAAWFRQGAFLLNTTGYWAMAMDAQEYADVSGVDP